MLWKELFWYLTHLVWYAISTQMITTTLAPLPLLLSGMVKMVTPLEHQMGSSFKLARCLWPMDFTSIKSLLLKGLASNFFSSSYGQSRRKGIFEFSIMFPHLPLSFMNYYSSGLVGGLINGTFPFNTLLQIFNVILNACYGAVIAILQQSNLRLYLLFGWLHPWTLVSGMWMHPLVIPSQGLPLEVCLEIIWAILFAFPLLPSLWWKSIALKI